MKNLSIKEYYLYFVTFISVELMIILCLNKNVDVTQSYIH